MLLAQSLFTEWLETTNSIKFIPFLWPIFGNISWCFLVRFFAACILGHFPLVWKCVFSVFVLQSSRMIVCTTRRKPQREGEVMIRLRAFRQSSVLCQRLCFQNACFSLRHEERGGKGMELDLACFSDVYLRGLDRQGRYEVEELSPSLLMCL